MMINRRRVCGSKKGLLPSGYTQLEYIENTSNAYIDTGIVPNRDFGIEMDCYILTEISTSATSAKLFGSSTFNNGAWGGIVIATYPTKHGGQSSWSVNVWESFDPKLKAYERITLKCINNVYTAPDGTITYINYKNDNNIYGTCYLFFIHSDRGISASSLSQLRVYNTKIYERYNVVRNFISCKNPQNVVGMYDTVNDVFYSSPNGTAFVAGPEV